MYSWYLHDTVPSVDGRGMLLRRIKSNCLELSCWLVVLRFVVNLELSWTLELRFSITLSSCRWWDLFPRDVLCVLCSRYSSDAWKRLDTIKIKIIIYRIWLLKNLGVLSLQNYLEIMQIFLFRKKPFRIISERIQRSDTTVHDILRGIE